MSVYHLLALTFFVQDYSWLDLPPSNQHPRTPIEWQAAQAALTAAGPGFYENFPEWTDQFDGMRVDLEFLNASYRDSKVKIDESVADQIVLDLFHDYGHPQINTVYQESLIGLIGDLASVPSDRLSASARSTLVAGLLRYAEVGGAQNSPIAQVALARSLYRLDPRHNEASEQVAHLLDDSYEWAVAIESDFYQERVARDCAAFFGDSFWLRHHEQRMIDKLPARRPAAYERAVELLAALLKSGMDERQLPVRVREAIDAASVPLDDPILSMDLLARRLLVYRVLLSRPESALPETVVELINRDLATLLVSSRPERDNASLQGAELWRIWANAVRALGPARVSRQLADRIERMSMDAALPEEVADGLRVAAGVLSDEAKARIANKQADGADSK